MAFIMNGWDVTEALEHYDGPQHDTTHLPNYRTAAVILAALVDWTNTHSDGWAYWQKPSNASKRLQAILAPWRTRYMDGDNEDLDHDTLVNIVKPIKAFLTRTSGQYDQEHHDSAIALRDDIATIIERTRP